jgi:23S rRNA (cytosine1962-C5)-methyltransferase
MGARYRVRFLGTRHPGLFLDHAPLRQWLRANSKDRRVLNAFAYTGSLSVAAGLGGAASTVTLDLAKPAIAWARENWELNELSDTKAKFITGDVFERLPQFKRQAQQFDCVILDPPSFARTKRGSFSTEKDLKRLHTLAMAVLAPGGILVTSINSENVSREKFEAEVFSAVRETMRRAEVLWKINLPESFPTRPGCEEDYYLKGLVLRVQGLSEVTTGT